MTPTEAVDRGFALVNWLAAELNGLPVEASRRNELAAACLSIAQDHHAAVIVLLERELYASAVALVRSQYEAYVLGLWLHHCATEQQVRRFARGMKLPPISSQLSEIESLDAYREGQLSNIKAESWSAMCSFTHTGALQVERWLTATAIEQNYPPEDLVQTANFTGAIALLSGIGMATLAKRIELAQRLLEKSREHAAA
jgi:hypothetical protein